MPGAGQAPEETEENQLVSLEKEEHVEVGCSQRNLGIELGLLLAWTL